MLPLFVALFPCYNCVLLSGIAVCLCCVVLCCCCLVLFFQGVGVVAAFRLFVCIFVLLLLCIRLFLWCSCAFVCLFVVLFDLLLLCLFGLCCLLFVLL